MLIALEGPSTKFSADEDGTVTLLCISRMRTICAFVMVVIPRLIICSFLSVCGALYLLHTQSVQDIILNAIALSFVLEIDELLYSFAPAPARHVVENSEPVDLHRALTEARASDAAGSSRSSCSRCCTALTHIVGHFSRAEACVAMIVGLLVFFYVQIGPDASDRLAHAQIILCGGQLDFVYGFNTVTLQVDIAATAPKSNDWFKEFSGGLTEDAVLMNTRLCVQEYEKFYDMHLIEEWGGPLTARPDVNNIRQQCDNIGYRESTYGPMYRTATDLNEVLALVSLTRTEARAALECVDAEYGTGTSYFHAAMIQGLRLLTPMQLQGLEVTDDLNCTRLQQYCVRAGQPDGSLHELAMRFCPETCKCHCETPNTCATTDWPYIRSGCPIKCHETRLENRWELAVNITADMDVCPEGTGFHTVPRFSVDGGVHAGVPQLFLQQVREMLVLDGYLNANYTPSDWVAEDFNAKTLSDFAEIIIPDTAVEGCYLNESKPIDFMDWAIVAPTCASPPCYDQVCSLIPLLKYIFTVDLCDDSDEVGNWIALCPHICGLTGPGTADPPCPLEEEPSTKYYDIVPFGGKDAEFGITCDRDGYICFDVEMTDAGKNGWDGAEVHIRNGFGTISTITLEDGEFGEKVKCLPKDECYFIEVTAGDHPDDVYWTMRNKVDDRVMAAGGAPYLGSLGCSEGGPVLSGECSLWASVNVFLHGTVKVASVISVTSAGGSLVTVAVHSPDDGRPLYEDVPRGNVSLGGRLCGFSANLTSGLDAFYYANVTREAVVATEDKLCLGTHTCAQLVGSWRTTCDAQLDAAYCLQPPGAKWAHTLREACPLACGAQDSEDERSGLQVRTFCQCETGLHNWCSDLNDIRDGVDDIADIANNACFDDDVPRTGSNTTQAKWCYVDPRCSKQGSFVGSDGNFRRHASATECTQSPLPEASLQEFVCWVRKGALRVGDFMPWPFACPRHCSNESIFADAPWASRDTKAEVCNEFLNTFDPSVDLALRGELAAVGDSTLEDDNTTGHGGNASNSSNEVPDHTSAVDGEFCTRIQSNVGCNCEACEGCAEIPWMVIGESPPGSCHIDEARCLVAESYDNAHCEVFVRLETAIAFHIQGVQVLDWNVEEHWDYLIMNGVKYSGDPPPSGAIPSGRLLWSTDSAVRSNGFRMCLNMSSD